MKLIKKYRKILTDWQVPKEDIPQIEEAIGKTRFTLGSGMESGREKRITIAQTIKILGAEDFLLGMNRSAFHYSTSRTNTKGQTVYFDSSRLFR